MRKLGLLFQMLLLAVAACALLSDHSEAAYNPNSTSSLNIPGVFYWTSGALNTAYRSFMGLATATVRANPAPGASGIKLISQTGRIPAGSWTINAANVLLSSSDFSISTYGFDISGDGKGATQILYAPASSGPAFNNNNAVLGWRIHDLSIDGADSGSDLIDSYSTGNAQELTLSDIGITGSFQYGLNLTGTNTNSENLFSRVDLTANTTAFINVANGVGSSADQFLNFWFDHVKDDNNSPLISLHWGGHVDITDSDHSGYDPGSQTYKVNLFGNAHADGVQYFIERGGRYELESQYAGAIYSEWGNGTVLWDGVDFSSQAFNGYAPSSIFQYYNFSNVIGAKISYRASDVMGLTKFGYGVNDGSHQKDIVFDQVDFNNVASFSGAMVFAQTSGGTNIGSIPVVQIHDSRADAATIQVVPNASLNWRTATIGFGQAQYVSFKNGFGQLPNSTNTSALVQFEKQQLITDILINVTAGAVSDGSTVTPTLLDEAANVLWTGTPFVYSSGQVVHYSVLIDVGTAVDYQLSVQMAGSSSTCTPSAGKSCDFIVHVAG